MYIRFALKKDTASQGSLWHTQGEFVVEGKAGTTEQGGRNAHVSFLVLRCFKQWWQWTDTTGQQLPESSDQIARADKTAVDWDALQGALRWLDMRRLVAEGDVSVNGER